MNTIACLGSGSGKAGEPVYDAMVEVGRILTYRGFTVITGGFGGVGMEAPAKGAKEAGGTAIGYTMLGKQGNSYLTETVDCQTQYLINSAIGSPRRVPWPEIQYGIRLGNLLAADGFVIAADGGPGTMVELMAFINLNYRIWQEKKRLVILKTNAESAWCDEMLNQLESWGVLPTAVKGFIYVALTPEQAVSWVIWQPDE